MEKDKNDKHCGDCKYFGELIAKGFHACHSSKAIYKACLRTATGCDKYVAKGGNHMLLCRRCIEAIKSRGEIVYVGSEYIDFEPDEEVKCEWCEEVDKVYDCIQP